MKPQLVSALKDFAEKPAALIAQVLDPAFKDITMTGISKTRARELLKAEYQKYCKLQGPSSVAMAAARAGKQYIWVFLAF